MYHRPIRSLLTAFAITLAAAALFVPTGADAHPGARMAHANGVPAEGRGQLRAQRAQRALRIAAEPALAAMVQMRMIERIHLRQNHADAAARMYRDVLTRTQDTRLRNFANMRLARVVAWQPRQLDETVVELQRGLDENLAQVK